MKIKNNLYSKNYSLLIVGLVLLINFSCQSEKSIPTIETGGASEMPTTWIDKDTGYKLTRIINVEGDFRSFYFHNNPFLRNKNNDGDLMVFYGSTTELQSDRWFKGSVQRQLYVVDLTTHKVTQLTNHPSSIRGEILAKKRREVIYQSGDSIFATSIDQQKTRLVYVFPDSVPHAGITTLNADETLLAGTYSVAEKDSILKNHPKKSEFFQLIYEAKLPHTLFTINIDSQQLTEVFSDRAWLNHVQFSPTDPNNLLFCHEGPWHKVDRIWNINISDQSLPVKVHSRTIDREIYGHEFYSVDGKTVWFDLQKPRGETFFLAGYHLNDQTETIYELQRDEWSIHYNISPDQTIFCGDGGDEKQVAKAKNGKWIYLFEPDGQKFKSTKLVNMQHHNYDLEPNVHFTPDGSQIIFRANFESHTSIYAVDLALPNAVIIN